jgi:hypothetical protein
MVGTQLKLTTAMRREIRMRRKIGCPVDGSSVFDEAGWITILAE